MSAHLLVVDDEEVLCELVGDELSDTGYKVSLANGAKAAQTLIASSKFDGIVTDMRMPDGNGLDVTRAAHAINKELPVVVITGYSDISIEDLFSGGVFAMLNKPVNFDLLFAVLKRLLLPLRERMKLNAFTPELKLIGISLQSTATVQSAEGFLGRNGAFLPAVSGLPDVGKLIDFSSTSFRNAPGIALSGKAIVRWCRDKAQGELRSGMGIEFVELSKESMDAHLDWLASAQPQHSIPKT